MATGKLRNSISISNPLLPPRPRPTISAPNNAHSSLKTSTQIWLTIATAAISVSLTSLSAMSDFKAYTHPNTTPTIIILSLQCASFHILLPLKTCCLAPDPLFSKLAAFVIDVHSWYIRLFIMLYSVGKSVEVEAFVFFVSFFINLLAITEVVEATEARMRLYHHMLFGATIRASYECYYRGGISKRSFICCHTIELVMRMKRTWNHGWN